ncbi:MAG: tetratricopeptide repeat protein [Desulfamplus sp.]|nr:tetratricopeptide repeat protein [Desulfamplus sp.]
MRHYLKRFANITITFIFTLAISLSCISLSGCSYLKSKITQDSTNQESTIQGSEKQGTTTKGSEKQGHTTNQGSENKGTINQDATKKEEPKFVDKAKDKNEKADYSKDAYYHYMASERYRQKGDMKSAIDATKQAIATDPNSIYLKKNLIFLYILNKDNENAVKAAEEFNKKHPNREEILVILAKLKLQSNKLNEAKVLYEQILKINPKNHDAYIVLGNISIENKRAEEAIKLFSTMAKELPDSYSSHFFLGKIYIQKKEFLKAEKEFLRTIELNNELIEPRFELISIYKAQSKAKKNDKGKTKSQNRKDEVEMLKKTNGIQTNKNQKIVNLYEEILNLDKTNIKANIGLPIYLYKNGEKSKASEMLIDFGQKYQSNDEIMTAMAKEIVGSDSKDDAIIVFTELLKETINESSDKSSIHYLAGLTFDALKDDKRAISHFMKVSPKSEQYKKSIFHIAYIYNQLGQNIKAIEFLESKFSQFPKDVELIGYLSAFYEEENQIDKALSLIKQGLKDAPDDTELLFRSGVILDKKGDKDGSMADMKKVIELDPEHSSALNYLGYTYAELGINLDEAEELIKRALAIKPDDGYITDSLGWVYYKKGDYDRAIEILEKAVKLSSGDAVIFEHLGDAYREKKSYLKAIEAYKNALSKNKTPENKALLEKKIYEVETLIKEN